ncbi:MAG: hypothetical protein PF446_13130 [Oleiagrimonas sp.]|jgi:hypothetical protein|nr:hypothetical protein [Oleiagrimonas sp.]
MRSTLGSVAAALEAHAVNFQRLYLSLWAEPQRARLRLDQR